MHHIFWTYRNLLQVAALLAALSLSALLALSLGNSEAELAVKLVLTAAALGSGLALLARVLRRV